MRMPNHTNLQEAVNFASGQPDRYSLADRIAEANKCHGITSRAYITKVLDELSSAPSTEISIWEDDESCIGLHEGAAMEIANQEYMFRAPTVENMTFGQFLYILSKALLAAELDESMGSTATIRKSMNLSIFLSTLKYGKTRNSLIMQLCDINFGQLRKIALERYFQREPKSEEQKKKYMAILGGTDKRSFDEVIDAVAKNVRKEWVLKENIEDYGRKMEYHYQEIETMIFYPLYLACGERIPLKKR